MFFLCLLFERPDADFEIIPVFEICLLSLRLNMFFEEKGELLTRADSFSSISLFYPLWDFFYLPHCFENTSNLGGLKQKTM